MSPIVETKARTDRLESIRSDDAQVPFNPPRTVSKREELQVQTAEEFGIALDPLKPDEIGKSSAVSYTPQELCDHGWRTHAEAKQLPATEALVRESKSAQLFEQALTVLGTGASLMSTDLGRATLHGALIAHYETGRLAFDKNEFATAIEHNKRFLQLLRNVPNAESLLNNEASASRMAPDALYFQGLAEQKTKNFQATFETFEAFVKDHPLDPNVDSARFYRAHALQDLGRLAEATQAFDGAQAELLQTLSASKPRQDSIDLLEMITRDGIQVAGRAADLRVVEDLFKNVQPLTFRTPEQRRDTELIHAEAIVDASRVLAKKGDSLGTIAALRRLVPEARWPENSSEVSHPMVYGAGFLGIELWNSAQLPQQDQAGNTNGQKIDLSKKVGQIRESLEYLKLASAIKVGNVNPQSTNIEADREANDKLKRFVSAIGKFYHAAVAQADRIEELKPVAAPHLK